MYRLPQSYKEYKKKLKSETSRVKRHRQKKKLETPSNVTYEVVNDIFFNNIDNYDYILLCIDIYNNLDTVYSNFLKKRYPSLQVYEFKLPYGDNRRMGSVNIVHFDKEATNLILFTVDNGDGVIDYDSLLSCFQKIKDYIPANSKCLCNLYGKTDLWKLSNRDKVKEDVGKIISSSSITFFRETIRDEEVYFDFVNAYLDERVKYTIFDEKFCDYLQEEDVKHFIYKKLGLEKYVKQYGKKKDKFDF